MALKTEGPEVSIRSPLVPLAAIFSSSYKDEIDVGATFNAGCVVLQSARTVSQSGGSRESFLWSPFSFVQDCWKMSLIPEE